MEKEKALVDPPRIDASREPKESRIADPSKSPRRLSSAGLPPNPSFEK
jgi:hypothetical protein